MLDHAPDAPQWTCRDCGDEWPCRQRRRETLTTHGPTGARVAMSVYWPFMVYDLVNEGTATTLYMRVYGWIPRHRPRQAGR